MINTTTLPTRPTLRGLVLALAVTALSSVVARAVPYASCITNNGTTVSYYLNEPATDVTVIYDGGGVGKTNDLGALTKGPHTFSMTGHTSYKIKVTQVAPVGWTLISDDSNLMNLYGSPRGVAVSQVSSNLSTFGRIYVADSAAPGGAAKTITDAATKLVRTNFGKGIYVLNADQSDCVGQVFASSASGIRVQPASNGIPFNLTTPSTSSPFHLGFGPDNKLYVNLFGTIDATTVRSTNADCFGFEVVLSGVGENVNTTVHTDSASKPIVRGSTQDGSLTLLTLDGAMSGPGGYNSIAEWDILGGPLPWNTPPTFVGTASAYSGAMDVTCDFNEGADGKWFILTDRSAGTDRASVQEYDTDGTTLLFDSFVFYGSPDPLRNAMACDLSPDGTTFSFLRIDNSVMLFTLTNGVIDTSTLFTLTAPASTSVPSPATGNGRQMCFDAAGNIYTVSSGQARLRTYAPGGFTVATTGSDGSFVVTKPSTSVSVTATTPLASMDTTQPPGVFTFTRVGDTASTLPVGYALTGTATNNVNYNLLSGTVTFQAGDTSTNVYVTAKATPAGPTRSVIVTISNSTAYAPAAPLTATVYIIDTNTPTLHVAARDTQFYERTNDLARFTLTRWGDTNIYLSQINVTYGGTATAGTQFYGDANTFMTYGDETKDVFVYPIHDGVVTGPLTVTATVAPASDGSYVVGTPATSGAVTRVDADDPPETVLWADNFSTDSSANWTVLFATTNGVAPDYCINAQPDGTSLPLIGSWPFDYSALAIPSAPHTTDGSTHGLYMTVNKNDTVPAAAALNLYLKGQSFSGNYALRFDMYLIENSSTYTTEYSLFGINHSGTKTNWFRGSTVGFTGVDPVGWSFDGVFYAIEADASGTDDYVGYSSPMAADHNPTPITSGVGATALTTVFKAPPWTAGGTAIGGSPANIYSSSTPIWADVEVKQVNGVLYWSINHTSIFSYTNTTGYTSGNIMLGYTDAYDSIGGTGGGVIYANVRVISLARPLVTKVLRNGNNAEITFTANAGDVTAQFTLQSASLVNGTYADTSSTITSLGGGVFKSVKAAAGDQQFYRIRRIE
jgi:hypothetical protein